jgi:hypothetical protein
VVGGFAGVKRDLSAWRNAAAFIGLAFNSSGKMWVDHGIGLVWTTYFKFVGGTTDNVRQEPEHL